MSRKLRGFALSLVLSTIPVFSTILVFSIWLSPAAQAAGVVDFYRGKTVSIVVGGSPGGGYDTLARLVSRFLGKHLPGAPDVIVRNMPGAGGIVAMNYIYNEAPQDGTVIGSPNNNTPFEPLYGTKQAHYDPLKLNWLGSPSPETSLLTLWRSVPVNTIDEARTHELRMGSSGANSTPSFYGKLLNEALGLKLRMIVGFPGQNEALLAMERGEIDGYPSAFYNSLMATRPNWIADKDVKLLVQMGAAPEPALPNVPFAPNLASNADDRRLLIEASAPLGVGRPYVTGPGVQADRVKLLQDGLFATFNDPAFRAEAETMKLGVRNPKSGGEIAKLIAETYASPPSDIARLRRMLSQ